MDRIVECLSQAEHLIVRKPLPGHRSEQEMLPMDGWVQVHTKDKATWIALDVKKNASPRDVRIEIDYLKRLGSAYGDSFYGVLGSEYLSPRVRQMCIENGIGFVDLEGNCRLSFSGVYIDKEVVHTKKPPKKELKSLFGEKASRVLRRLFNTPHTSWDVKTLATSSNVSPATVSLVKSKLLAEELAIHSGNGFQLSKPDRLLEEWGKNYTENGETLEFYTKDDLSELEAKIAEMGESSGIMYGFTSFSGARRVAPFTRGIQKSYLYVIDVYCVERMKELLDLKKVEFGGTVRITVPSDTDIFYGSRRIEGDWIMSDIQLYLDLMKQGGRAVDNAEFLLTNRIQDRWQ